MPELAALFKPLSYLTQPEYRVFWGYLLISLPISVWVYRRQTRSIKPGMRFLFSKQLWLNPSVLLDFKLIFVNHAIWITLLAPLLISQLTLALSVNRELKTLLGAGDFFSPNKLTISIIYTVIIFIVDDFSRFYIHRLYHKVPWLWRFHAVHHSATLLTPFTLYRVHLVEMFINALRSILVMGVIGGLFIYLIDGRFSKLELLGTSIFSLAFNLLGANLRHSHIWLSFGKVEQWIISPAQHQIHHSANPSHFDKNFGVMIATWDRIFNSWIPSKNNSVSEVGLAQPIEQTLKAHCLGIK